MNPKSLVGENHCCLARGISSNFANSLEFQAKSNQKFPSNSSITHQFPYKWWYFFWKWFFSIISLYGWYPSSSNFHQLSIAPIPSPGQDPTPMMQASGRREKRPKIITPLDDFSEKTTMLILHNTYNTYINLYTYIYIQCICVYNLCIYREREKDI